GRAGVPFGTRTVFLWGHHLDPVKSEHLRDRWYSFATNVRWFDCFRMSTEKLERYHLEFARIQPGCIVAYAGAISELAEFVLDNNYQASYPAICVVTGAEKLLPHHRAMIEAAFRRPVRERYGGRDTGCIGFQTKCGRSDFEVDWANLFIEPETTSPESSILVTKLHADAMPMLRYRIGDAGRFAAGSRPGFPTFTLQEVLGREVDRIWLPDGRWIHGAQLPHLMKDHPVREYRLVQRADFGLELEIVPKEALPEASRRAILSTVRANLPDLHCDLRVVDVIPHTPPTRARPVVSKVNPALGSLAS